MAIKSGGELKFWPLDLRKETVAGNIKKVSPNGGEKCWIYRFESVKNHQKNEQKYKKVQKKPFRQPKHLGKLV